MSSLDLLIMCGNKLRHKYFAIKLMKMFPNSKVLIEAKLKNTAHQYSKEPSPEIKIHFQEFESIEKNFFEEIVNKNEEFFNSKVIKSIEYGTVNDKENVEFIKTINPKIIAVHSTSLIKNELISLFPKRLINLHAGLSPYYRGSGTNLWPFYNQELEYVGMTIHFIDAGIDSGDIILQGRPEFDENDNTHSIGCKNLILGTQLMIKSLSKFFEEGALPSFKQNLIKGKLYLRKHFSEDITLKIRELLKQGLVKKYLKNPKKIDIIEW